MSEVDIYKKLALHLEKLSTAATYIAIMDKKAELARAEKQK